MDFYRRSKAKNRLRSECKACTRLYQIAHREEHAVCARRWREAHPEKSAVSSYRWRETHPRSDAARSRRWRKTYPEKAIASARRWDKAHPEINATRGRRWKQHNRDKTQASCQKRRALKLSAFGADYTTAQMIEDRCEYYGRLCYLCGAPSTAMDHVKPLIRGGAHLPCNLRPICQRCNSAKGGKWPYPSYSKQKVVNIWPGSV